MAIESTSIKNAIQALIGYTVKRQLTDFEDRLWLYNKILESIGATGPAPDEEWVLMERPYVSALIAARKPDAEPFDLEATLAVLADAAVDAGIVEDSANGRDRISMRIMGLLMPRPSQINEEFRGRCGIGESKSATDWFYNLCCDAGYVRRAAIARNIKWETPTEWGNLEITINLSKPEKDPRDIAAAGSAKNSLEVYPACQLCIQNEGYPGRPAAINGGHPARQNLRIVPLELGGERWGFQYSPYAYFNEHCIAMSAIHRPMHIDRKALTCLFDFIDTVPHYFIGSNADLPIVGGSILSHDHFQGGAHVFPMMKAEVAAEFSLKHFPGVTGAVLKWPMSVLRLRSASRDELLNACVRVIDSWRDWDDEAAGIVSHDADGTRHNTVTPVLRRIDDAGRVGGSAYEAYLALRCNITSEEHPLGIFHPHAELHHIKKENIGLIEVMGLAILPPRLVPELSAVGETLLAAKADSALDLAAALAENELTASHAAWAKDVFDRRSSELDAVNINEILHEEVGYVFGHVLEDAGVFKWDPAGRSAQQRFVDSL